MIGLLGLDHHWATTTVRGRLTFADDGLRDALRTLHAERVIDEIAILSTCNRTEVYVAALDWPAARECIERFLAEAFRRGEAEPLAALLPGPATTGWQPSAAAVTASPLHVELPAEVAEVLYVYEDLEAARHLFMVSAGLQSMVVGEAQILGQVKDALTAAEAVHSVGEELRGLFTQAIKVGKRVRAETEIGRADVSVASLAVHVASESLGSLAGATALVIGAGRTSQLCAQLLRAEGIGRLILANRTPTAAEDLALEVGGEAIGFDALADVIGEVQLIVSATAAPHLVLAAQTVADGLGARTEPLVIIDLAVPADVEEAAGLLAPVTLYTLDTLRAMDAAGGAAVAQASEGHLGEVRRAETIIETGLRDLVRAQTMRLVVPGIAALRRHVDRSEQAELALALAHLDHLPEADREIVSRFGQRLVDKMFHHLVSRIRALAEYDEVPPETTMRVLAQLFADPDRRSEPPTHE